MHGSGFWSGVAAFNLFIFVLHYNTINIVGYVGCTKKEEVTLDYREVFVMLFCFDRLNN